MIPYVTNSDADIYFETRYKTELWNTQTEDNKTRLLCDATRLIDALNYCGDKHNVNQQLEFPRGADVAIPQIIKDACCDIAFAILNGRDIEYDNELISLHISASDNGRLVVDPKEVSIAKIHNIPSIIAWYKLRPYLRDGSAITLVRIS
jgi:hypothetical protein